MAYLFDAAGEQINVTGVTFPTTGALFLWWYPTSDSFTWAQILIGQASGFNDFWRLYRDFANTSMRFMSRVGGGSDGPNATISAPSLNTWHSVCINWTDGGASELFLDNVSIATDNPIDVAALTSTLTIGNGNDYATGPVMGRIAEVSMYNANLDSTARTSLHGFNIPSQGSTGIHYWPLDGNANDSWGSANGTVVDATTATHPTMSGGGGGGGSTFVPQVIMVM